MFAKSEKKGIGERIERNREDERRMAIALFAERAVLITRRSGSFCPPRRKELGSGKT